MDNNKAVTFYRNILSCLFLLHQLVTISAQRTCTHLATNDGEIHNITSPNYPANYDRDTTKCWILEAAYPSHKIKLDPVDFHLAPELYCLNDYLEIRHDSSSGELVGKYCSSQRPRVISTGRTLYLRFVSDHTDTDRGFLLQYTSIEAPTVDEEQTKEDTEKTNWLEPPNLYLLIIAGVVVPMFLICFATVIVACKADKEPKKKPRTKRHKRMPPSQASSQQNLATHIQIEHTTHNESLSSLGTLEPSAPPIHYGNANPSSHIATLPPSYSVAIRGGGEAPYMAYGNETFGMS